MNPVFEQLKGGLVVSCQAEGDSPFNIPERVADFAEAAVQGGAIGIRSQGVEKTKAIIDRVALPVIGLIKSEFEDGYVRITGSFQEVEQLIAINTDIIAIDGTFREREGMSGPAFIKEVKARYDCVVMADIATVEEGIACAEAGADCLSTTLSGYTPDTKDKPKQGPDFAFLSEMVQQSSIPVFAEGRVNTPEDAAKMIQLGAWGVVVGSAITRPHLVTQWYVEKIGAVNAVHDV
ncbi:N-acetylmannosamine-6-phosphate 2-epimerase [Algivirga pacifica]|uniref:Putative N-acetylmannosamine-6-phosphate 2-epimerase n=1 Tax=Algivirga pacifica TaxID=1162670 RepID=A0ABP9D7J8_9BACT